MESIGIFFGSDTGNTENVAKLIHKYIGTNISSIHDIANTNKKDIELFNILIFGVSTWYYGELQCDWDDFLPTLKKINFNNKIIALFGCGDQEDYSEYFCDGIGILYNVIRLSKNVRFIGSWTSKGYSFECSKALDKNKNFLGLVIDEDRQPEQSNQRIIQWTKKIKTELNSLLN
ncbi:flavodoxin [Buchnera aphidicola str. Bp (Baizongia pistaciae)]|uniref:Flavodoxin n=1 Tax=Buchnera aphidicola subsp. Baizongia pistaciae (strain Bp) TaxID=224915 RepID=FLAV_BUCBP|nr:flavodoxin FldA [Buchnera aphidicola]Q89AK0.1 RecName: Full=Flavodoxin [Buchnera aphidicola str. Bp (Baizongia pistaciae)]AAO27002.1 flavodoxin [Buchnera aphidicola str. Bp (Baizongia pistaciae)]